MGVCCVIYAISDRHIDAILADPPLVLRVVSQDDDSSYLAALKSAARPSLISRLLGRAPAPIEPRPLLLDEAEQYMVDLDKSWDMLNRVLTVLVPSAPHLFDAPDCPGGIDVGYGPAMYQRSGVVSQLAAACADITPADLDHALRVTDFSGAYLAETWLRRDKDALDYLNEHFTGLQAFLAHARRNELGALIQMT